MRKILTLTLLCSMVLAMFSIPPARAAADNLPVVVRIGGRYPYLAAWVGTTFVTFAEVHDDPNWGNPHVSPDGTRVAYTDYSSLIPFSFQNEAGDDVPTDIFLRSLNPVSSIARGSSSGEELVRQPKDAMFTPGKSSQPQNFVVRSEPSWSPGGEALAWTEYTVDTRSGQVPKTAMLKVFYFGSTDRQAQTLAADIPLQSGKYRLANPQWGTSGILVPVSADNGYLHLLIYDRDGELRYDKQYDYAAEVAWLDTPTGSSVLLGTNLQYLILDEKSGKTSPIQGTLELATSRGIVSIDYGSASRQKPQWQVGVIGTAYPLDGLASSQAFPTSVMGISFDGEQIAYVNTSGELVIIATGGVMSKLSIDLTSLGSEPIISLSWGPTMWRIWTY